MTTAQVCKMTGLERVTLQVIIKRLRIRPRQEVRAGRKTNLYTKAQVDRLLVLLGQAGG